MKAIQPCVLNRVLNRFFITGREGDDPPGLSCCIEAVKGCCQDIACSADAPDVAVCGCHPAVQQDVLDFLHGDAALGQQAGCEASDPVEVESPDVRLSAQTLDEVLPLFVRFPGLLAGEDMTVAACRQFQTDQGVMEGRGHGQPLIFPASVRGLAGGKPDAPSLKVDVVFPRPS